MLVPGQCVFAVLTSAVLGGGSVPPQARAVTAAAQVEVILEKAREMVSPIAIMIQLLIAESHTYLHAENAKG